MANSSNYTDFDKRKEPSKTQPIQVSIVLLSLILLSAFAYFILNPSDTSIITQERLELDPYLGNPNAPVTITEYAAYGCDSCRRWHQAGIVEQILSEFPNQVKFIYRDIPIILPSWSQEMAEVAQCALDQGQDAFWVMHDALYIETILGRTTQEQAVQLGINLGLDADALQICVENDTHAQTVRYDMQRPEALGIRGVPTWFVNGQLIYNASPSQLREMINIELSGLSG
jgi:protein-disulfide isomerase